MQKLEPRTVVQSPHKVDRVIVWLKFIVLATPTATVNIIAVRKASIWAPL